MALSVISLNCECDRHLDKIPAFLEASEADVICLQEITMPDADRLGRDLGYTVTANPQDLFPLKTGELEVRGIAILTKDTPHRRGIFLLSLGWGCVADL